MKGLGEGEVKCVVGMLDGGSVLVRRCECVSVSIRVGVYDIYTHYIFLF